MPITNEPIIALDVRGLTRHYESLIAVDKISFRVTKGKIFGLLGPNGAGKSTTIKMLTTLLPPTSGTAEIFGVDLVTDSAQVRKNIGYVPQLISSDGDLSGYENLLLSAKLYGLDRAMREKRIQEVLAFMNLTEMAQHMVREYSGGMIRRLEIAQAFIHQPELLFLDEPSVGLDPGARKILWKLILDLREEYDTTILMTTHDMDEADKLCDIVAFIHLGHIVAMDSPEHLKSKIGPGATLDDVFIYYTGTSVKEGGSYAQAKQIRRTISRLE